MHKLDICMYLANLGYKLNTGKKKTQVKNCLPQISLGIFSYLIIDGRGPICAVGSTTIKQMTLS